MNGTGLDGDGYIKREGDLSRVPAAFAPLIAALTTAIPAVFTPARLHSAYLYGSIPRGTAVPGISDLDVLAVLHDEPDAEDRAALTSLGAELDDRFAEIDGVSMLLNSAATLLSDLERYDLGWFVACLCTPLLGQDLAARLPRYRPSSLLARETNGDIGDLLPRWREQFARPQPDDSLRALARRVGRRLVRTGFTLVMPRWGGWTSDLDESAAVFGDYYPARCGQMRAAAGVARTPLADRAVLGPLIHDLAPWLAAEYAAVHGQKTPRTPSG